MSQNGKGFLQKLWTGDFSLPKTFWVYWLLPNIALNFLAEDLFIWAVSLGFFFTIIVIVIYSTIFLVYNLIAIVGIWQSSKKHTGLKLWPFFAKLTVASCLSLAFILAIILFKPGHNEPPDIDSSNINKALNYSKEYPLVGFWKKDCFDDFGLAIDVVGDGLYSVSFCGPGGCFEPGTYRPNTPIIDDPNYQARIQVVSATLIVWFEG